MRTVQIVFFINLFLAFFAGNLAYSQSKNLVEVAVSSKDHSTLVAAVKAGELVEVLSGKDKFTVFAPTNAAFEKLPQGTLETLLKPENKKMLQGILTYHVVKGKLDAKAVQKAIEKGNGKAEVTTVQGGKLIATIKNGNLILVDEKGNSSSVITTDLMANNGVVHVIDSVVLPK